MLIIMVVEDEENVFESDVTLKSIILTFAPDS